MKKNTLKIMFLAFVAIVGNVAYSTQPNEIAMPDMVLANIEALASGENLEPGHYNISEDITDHFYNGGSYKQSKVVNCSEGGRYKCSSGKSYRYKKDDGTWSSWIPA